MGCCDGNAIARGVAGLAKAATGVGRADEAVIRERRDACRACDAATRNPELADRPSRGLTTWSRCKACSCWIAAKTAVANETCPLGKW